MGFIDNASLLPAAMHLHHPRCVFKLVKLDMNLLQSPRLSCSSSESAFLLAPVTTNSPEGSERQIQSDLAVIQTAAISFYRKEMNPAQYAANPGVAYVCGDCGE